MVDPSSSGLHLRLDRPFRLLLRQREGETEPAVAAFDKHW
jgi:hypothetical protein